MGVDGRCSDEQRAASDGSTWPVTSGSSSKSKGGEREFNALSVSVFIWRSLKPYPRQDYANHACIQSLWERTSPKDVERESHHSQPRLRFIAQPNALTKEFGKAAVHQASEHLVSWLEGSSLSLPCFLPPTQQNDLVFGLIFGREVLSQRKKVMGKKKIEEDKDREQQQYAEMMKGKKKRMKMEA
ncbi:hypothetical protein Cgig2_021821 [Carnegiea gigantea]|uniref:Uncharacterized protein n=1 Tax=Carnegiea gigantea TaxID=171969 RepID=A0A9Q1GKK9_9CARY|nr:hypothetical protein Cgig2_021821 [Carnegiea gigantea]